MNINDISSIQFDNHPNYDYFNEKNKYYNKSIQNSIDSIVANNEERKRNEAEDRENLRLIAENSKETVDSLMETNKILIENNKLLNEKNELLSSRLSEISNVITRLVDLSGEYYENEEEMMRQANALAVQLNKTADDNSKFDWKGLLANTTANTLLLGLQIFMQQHGIS